MQAIRSMYSTLHGLLSRNIFGDEEAQSLLARPREEDASIAGIAAQLWTAGGLFRRRPRSSPDHAMSQVVVQSIIFAAGITPYFGPIDEMWSLLRISAMEDKIAFMQEHQAKYLHQGTMLMLCEAMTWAASNKFSHGSWLDAYHLCYAQIVQHVLTLDLGMLEFRNSWPDGRARDSVGHAGRYIENLRQVCRMVRKKRNVSFPV